MFSVVGGSEINPSHVQLSFDENRPQQDSSWEFNTFSDVKDNVCQKGDHSLTWEAGKGVRSFTTKQQIVQDHYMLQFKVRCSISKGDHSLTWEAGKGVRSFTTKQQIVQDDYILQFKVRCSISKGDHSDLGGREGSEKLYHQAADCTGSLHVTV